MAISILQSAVRTELELPQGFVSFANSVTAGSTLLGWSTLLGSRVPSYSDFVGNSWTNLYGDDTTGPGCSYGLGWAPNHANGADTVFDQVAGGPFALLFNVTHFAIEVGDATMESHNLTLTTAAPIAGVLNLSDGTTVSFSTLTSFATGALMMVSLTGRLSPPAVDRIVFAFIANGEAPGVTDVIPGWTHLYNGVYNSIYYSTPVSSPVSDPRIWVSVGNSRFSKGNS